MALERQDVSKEQKAIMLWMPHMVGLAFMLKHYKASGSKIPQIANDPGMIACTDGSQVWYGPKYNEIEQSGRNFIFLHEMLHGIFRHTTRTQLIQLQKGTVFPVLANYAADAIINEAIYEEALAKTAQFVMPEKFPGVRMATIHEIVKEAAKFSGEDPISSYDPEARLGQQMETVYEWLVWAYEAVRRKRREDQADQGQKGQKGQKGESGSGSSSGNGSGQKDEQTEEQADDQKGSGGQKPDEEAEKEDGKDGSGNQDGQDEQEGQDEEADGAQAPTDETEIERIVRSEEAWDLAQAVEELRKLINEGANVNDLIAQANGEIDAARGKIQAIIQGIKLQGIGQGNMLLALENDLPAAVVPWNHILRRTVTRELGTKMDDSYTRLGASTRAALSMGRRAHYQPGTTIFTERPRILVVLDVSGSHISELNQCFAEIWSIVKMKNAAVDVVTFDHNVQQKIEIRNIHDFRKIIEDGITGGGGTVLGDVFKEVKKMRTPYRACIIMTDGYLSPPENTEGLSLVWMITNGGTSEGLKGTGEIINLPDYSAGSRQAA